MSRRPDSTIARSTRRPMRPKPLIATRSAISSLLVMARHLRTIVFLFQKFFGCRHRRIGGDAELGIDVLIRSAGAEAMHADEGACGSQQFRTNVTVPALA